MNENCDQREDTPPINIGDSVRHPTGDMVIAKGFEGDYVHGQYETMPSTLVCEKKKAFHTYRTLNFPKPGMLVGTDTDGTIAIREVMMESVEAEVLNTGEIVHRQMRKIVELINPGKL